ncbi:unnamed protein product, partial [Mesorhabditis belari]|uniref:Uncharacterized protein n=1 Tax=Mesorhabditis belari TaxID=2138241 RepID=A0AAF3FBK4_9BILA
MSDGLLCEASALLAARIFVTAAEQNHYGEKRLLSSVDVKGAATSRKGNQNEKGSCDTGILDELKKMRDENAEIKQQLRDLRGLIEKLQNLQVSRSRQSTVGEPAKEEQKGEEDDFDLFGSEDEEDDEKKKVVEERLKAYNEKKSKKPGPIAKSSIILDVKPWDDTTSLEELEKLVRSIEKDGLVWGGAKQIPIGYGIKKLQIICVVEDAKVSVDDVTEEIEGFDELCQSVDVVAFNKI